VKHKHFLVSDSSALPSSIVAAQRFFKTYKNSTKSGRYHEASKIAGELTELIESNIDTTAEDMRLFGIKLLENKVFLESILIFDAASTMSEKIENSQKKLEMIQFCVAGMRDTNKAMIADDSNMKVVVKDHVIPLMRDKLHRMKSTSAVSEQYKCLQMSWVLHYIEWSQCLVDQWKEREQTLREGVERSNEVFRQNKVKHWVYGLLFNNLGIVCEGTSRYEEAASFFKQAVDVYQAATDYYDREDRKQHIERSEINLRRVQQKIE